MCKDSDAPDSMRRRFEAVVAEAQEKICKAIEERYHPIQRQKSAILGLFCDILKPNDVVVCSILN